MLCTVEARVGREVEVFDISDVGDAQAVELALACRVAVNVDRHPGAGIGGDGLVHGVNVDGWDGQETQEVESCLSGGLLPGGGTVGGTVGSGCGSGCGDAHRAEGYRQLVHRQRTEFSCGTFVI